MQNLLYAEDSSRELVEAPPKGEDIRMEGDDRAGKTNETVRFSDDDEPTFIEWPGPLRDDRVAEVITWLGQQRRCSRGKPCWKWARWALLYRSILWTSVSNTDIGMSGSRCWV